MLYRGPKKKLNRNYIAFLGGTETYGKFVASPYPEMVGCEIDQICVNLACNNCGIDAILQDDSLLSICNRAEVTVLQILGASDLSNRFYTVHPRRNDRFIQASPLMERLFPQIDFMEFNFTKHLLARVRDRHPDKYGYLVNNLQETWVARMSQLLARLQGRVILLWMADHQPPQKPLHTTPYLVTKGMVAKVARQALGSVEVVFSDEAMALGTDGMHFLNYESAAAQCLPGPVAHQEVADQLLPVLRNMA